MRRESVFVGVAAGLMGVSLAVLLGWWGFVLALGVAVALGIIVGLLSSIAEQAS